MQQMAIVDECSQTLIGFGEIVATQRRGLHRINAGICGLCPMESASSGWSGWHRNLEPPTGHTTPSSAARELGDSATKCGNEDRQSQLPPPFAFTVRRDSGLKPSHWFFFTHPGLSPWGSQRLCRSSWARASHRRRSPPFQGSLEVTGCTPWSPSSHCRFRPCPLSVAHPTKACPYRHCRPSGLSFFFPRPPSFYFYHPEPYRTPPLYLPHHTTHHKTSEPNTLDISRQTSLFRDLICHISAIYLLSRPTESQTPLLSSEFSRDCYALDIIPQKKNNHHQNTLRASTFHQPQSCLNSTNTTHLTTNIPHRPPSPGTMEVGTAGSRGSLFPKANHKSSSVGCEA